MMKKVFLIFATLLISLVAHTQETKRFTFATAISTGIPLTTPGSTPFSWQILGYYTLSRHFSIGPGTGLSFYQKILIPLFADVKFIITRPSKYTPFLECGVGYSFAPDKKANGGFYIHPSVGLQYSLPHAKKIFIAAGYELQKYERLKTYKASFATTEFVEALNHSLITLKIGFIF